MVSSDYEAERERAGPEDNISRNRNKMSLFAKHLKARKTSFKDSQDDSLDKDNDNDKKFE